MLKINLPSFCLKSEVMLVMYPYIQSAFVTHPLQHSLQLAPPHTLGDVPQLSFFHQHPHGFHFLQNTARQTPRK